MPKLRNNPFPISKAGSALVGVLAISILLSIAAAGYIGLARNTVNSEHLALNDTRALLAAESGLLIAGSLVLQQDEWPASDLPDLLGELLRGENAVNGFDVTVDASLTGLEGDSILITSTATSPLIFYDKQISLTIYNTGLNVPFDTNAFDHGIFAGEEIHIAGNGDIRNPDSTFASAHTNGTFQITGNSNVQANISASDDITMSGNSNHIGTSETQVQPIDFPDIDLTPWKTTAQQNGQRFTSLTEIPFQNNTYEPEGGILWIDSDEEIKISQKTITGTIIVNGDISFESSSLLLGPDDNFAIASVSGNIRVSTGEIEGLIYAKNGNYIHDGQGTVNGQIIAKGSVTRKGSPQSTLTITYKRIIPIIPETGTNPSRKIISGSWSEKNISF
ncbi:hypothetical protein CHISP_2299 [Chitinispirillum alkaliphilum]|nr:hypothetical protein CHISP_2299 [Chitinispirillum alkaliphilum]